MNKLILVVLSIAFLFVGNISAKEKNPVKEITSVAKKIAKGKISNSRFNAFVEYYPKAVKQIEDLKKSLSVEKFGYDKLVATVPSWIGMYKELQNIGGTTITSKKGKTTNFSIVDYSDFLIECKHKAAEAHFNEATHILEVASNFEDVKKAFSHFNDTKYYSDKYNQQIKDVTTEEYYKEGLKILNTAPNFDEKEKCTYYFGEALKITSGYKDINTLVANMYYEGGVELSNSVNIEELSLSIKRLILVDKWVDNYKDTQQILLKVRNSGAEKIYAMATEFEKEESFKGQKKASDAYTCIDTWVKDYKDANERAEITKKKSVVEVIMVNKNGYRVAPNMFSWSINQETNDFIQTSILDDRIKNFDLRNKSVYPKINSMYAKRFVYVILKKEFDEEYSTASSVEKDELKTYTSTYSKTDGTAEITTYANKKEWDNTKLVADLAGSNNNSIIFEVHSGVLTTEILKSNYSATFTIEIWDSANPDDPELLDSKRITIYDGETRKKQTYSGAEIAKPKVLISQTQALLGKAGLSKKNNSINMTINELLMNQSDKAGEKYYKGIVESLNEYIVYKKTL